MWEKVCAEQGNCLGKKCNFYNDCFWQAAKRRMQGGKILIVNHALFFSDLALRMAGINYLPKYDAVILDEAHTVEDVAGEHFGLKVSEGGLRYQLRNLFDPKRGKGLLSGHGSYAIDAMEDIEQLSGRIDRFFSRVVRWQQQNGRSNGRVDQPKWIENDISPKLRDLSLHLKAMLTHIDSEEEMSEVTAQAEKVANLGQMLEVIVSQSLEDAVYWIEITQRGTQKISLHAAPINIGAGLKKHLFEKTRSVVLTSATLCTSASNSNAHGRGAHATKSAEVLPRGTGASPVASFTDVVQKREGAYLPHWTKEGAVYGITFHLGDSLPKQVLDDLKAEREAFRQLPAEMHRQPTEHELNRLTELQSAKVEKFLNAGHGACHLRDERIAQAIVDTLKKFDGSRYTLLAWCVMPNHVHLVLQPRSFWTLPQIMHTLKSWTAKEANRLLGRGGSFWQSEYYDHIVRDENELIHCVDYVWSNPDKACLGNWSWRWKDEERTVAMINGSAESNEDHGRGAHATVSAGRAPSGTGASPVILKKAVGDSFAYIKSRLGIENAFDYQKQATLFVESDLPEPNDPLFVGRACERIVHYLKMTAGGAFVLFTSYGMLNSAHERLKPILDELKLPLLVHGQGPPARVLLERFKSTPNAVLLGTTSFWQGVDVQGDQLRNVIVVKLPFAVPDEPVIEARLDAIRKRGGNPFMEYSVPEAIIKLKQGFGRLIRSKTDEGIVVILDSRIKTKRYGRLFLDALPACRTVAAEDGDDRQYGDG